MIFKTKSKRLPTKEEEIFFKYIINEKGKETNKVFIIRYRKNHKDKLKIIGNIHKV